MAAGLVEADADFNRLQFSDATVSHGLTRGAETHPGMLGTLLRTGLHNHLLRAHGGPQRDGLGDVVSLSLIHISFNCAPYLEDFLLIAEFRKRNVHQQIIGDFFQFGFQCGIITAVGQLQSGGGLEERFAGHRPADTFAGKFLDVHIRARQCMGCLLYTSRCV